MAYFQSTKQQEDELRFLLQFEPRATKSLFLGDLSFFCTEMDIRELFAQYGIIMNLEIKRGRHGDSLMHGFLEYDREVSAYKAIKAMNGKKFKGRKMRYGVEKLFLLFVFMLNYFRVNWTNMKLPPNLEMQTWSQLRVTFVVQKVSLCNSINLFSFFNFLYFHI
jgi:RNA recognition motif-containing protein